MGSIFERGVEAIGRQQWLEPAAERLQKLVSGAYEAAGPAGRPLKNALHGVWLGHPLHPALTDIPIGAWNTAAVFDTIDALHGNDDLAAAADGAIVFGLVGAVGSALSGLTDWQHTDGAARRMGVLHAWINTDVTLLYLTSLILRRRGNRSAGRALAFLGLGLGTVSAYIGGHLISGEAIGVNHARDQFVPAEFTPVLADAALPENEPRLVEVGGTRVLLVRRGGEICALADTCSHLGGPLSEGTLEDGSIVCPWHGSRFALEDGRVLDGPATFPQPCYEARVQNGQIEVRAPATEE